jgi:hypothetical protein
VQFWVSGIMARGFGGWGWIGVGVEELEIFVEGCWCGCGCAVNGGVEDHFRVIETLWCLSIAV